MKKIKYILVLLFCFSLGNNLFAQTNNRNEFTSTIPFKGVLTDENGKVLKGNFYNFTFSIYTTKKLGTPIWTEVHTNVPVINGDFDVTLGKGSPANPLNLPFDQQYYLGIKINNQEEMSQRLKFVSVPYALGSKFANSVPDNSITSSKLVDGSVTNDKIKSISINKIINIPPSIGSISKLNGMQQIMGSDYAWWTTQGNLIFGPERHFLGVRNSRDFVIKTWEVQRMLFDPFGYIVLGMISDSVDFEVNGLSTFDYIFVKKNFGIGVDPALAKMHIDAQANKTPFLVDYKSNNIFKIDTLGRVVITTTLNGSDNSTDNYPLYIHGGDHGISIRVDGNSNGNNNYMSFWDDSGMVGRIEGQNAGDYWSKPASIAEDVYFAALVSAEVVAAVSFLYPLPIPTEPADIISIAADIAEISFVRIWETTHLGVTYESGAGDYAEWLKRTDTNEVISAGDIVSVNGGEISKNTAKGEQFMAVSSKPIVLGNKPDAENKSNYQIIAFMGQIPVKVRGIVHTGDFIIPSGLNDGTGIAIAPEYMTADEFEKVVGRAWSSSQIQSVKLINTLIGLDGRDVNTLAKNQSILEKNNLTNFSLLSKKIGFVKNRLKNVSNNYNILLKNINTVLEIVKKDLIQNRNKKIMLGN